MLTGKLDERLAVVSPQLVVTSERASLVIWKAWEDEMQPSATKFAQS